MTKEELIISEIERLVMKSFVCDLARNQDVIKKAVRIWSEELYSFICNMDKIASPNKSIPDDSELHLEKEVIKEFLKPNESLEGK